MLFFPAISREFLLEKYKRDKHRYRKLCKYRYTSFEFLKFEYNRFKNIRWRHWRIKN